jgi:hypothetical protein
VINDAIFQGLDVTPEISAQQLQFPQDAVHPALHRALRKGHAPEGSDNGNTDYGTDLQHVSLLSQVSQSYTEHSFHTA